MLVQWQLLILIPIVTLEVEMILGISLTLLIPFIPLYEFLVLVILIATDQ